MDMKEIKALADLMDTHGLASLEWQQGESWVALTKPAGNPAAAPAPAPPPAEEPKPEAPTPEADDKRLVKAPLVGCVYLAAGPGEAPFVQPGAAVKKGQTLCIIEAMKVMNELPAPRDGVVAEVCVKNEALVEFGQPLFRFE